MATKHFKRIEIGECVIPEDAHTLIENINTLNIVLDLLGKIRCRSLEEKQMMRRVGFLLSGALRVAEEDMKYGYLCGKPIKPKHARQTLADVWRMLLDGSHNRILNEWPDKTVRITDANKQS